MKKYWETYNWIGNTHWLFAIYQSTSPLTFHHIVFVECLISYEKSSKSSLRGCLLRFT